MADVARQELSIRDYAGLLWRRKWIVIAMVVILPICAALLTKRHHPMYQATATVATREGNLAATVSGVPDYSYAADPTRLAATQIALASTPEVAQAVISRAHVSGIDRYTLLGSTTIVPSAGADLLYFTVKLRDPAMAIALANGWAEQYTAFRRQYDTAGYRQAAADLRNSAARLKARGQRANAAALNAKAASLETIAQLQTGNSSVANMAFGAAKIAPSVKREVGIGIGLGLVLGIGLAFLWDAFDTRVRGPEDVTRRTGLVLMARIPPPPRKLGPDELVMFTEPASVEAEAFRVLRTNLEFATLDLDARSIMLTSALEKEGKSTTISNLAIAQARAGKRVALVDLDLRRPRLDRLFRLTGQPGLTNVVLGHASLDEATARIALDAKSATRLNPSGNGNGAGHAPMDGRLDVIPSGPIPPDPGEFVSAASLGTLLETLESRYDLVLIDTPPILRVGDALTLAPRVSAVLVVTRIPGMKRPVLSELRRMLEVVPSPVLGFVLTGDVGSESYHAGYYYDYRQRTSGQLAVPVTPTRPRQ